MPFFSIIIPGYNREAFLKKTIRSVIEQSYADFELLFIDDGSTDHTKELIRSLADEDQRIRYFYQENSERGRARNLGIEKARGDYLIFLDSDDEFLPGHLQTLYQFITSNPNVNLIATKFDFKENNKIFKAPIDRLEEGYYDYTILLNGNPFACNVCVKKENLSLLPFPEDRSYAAMEDWIFLIQNTWTKDLYLINATTVRMNEHPNRSMRFNQLISDRRQLATEYILKHFHLNKSEVKQLKGYSAYFSAIHYYLDEKKRDSFRFLLQAIRLIGPKKKLLILLLKLPFSKGTIGKLKDVLHHNVSENAR